MKDELKSVYICVNTLGIAMINTVANSKKASKALCEHHESRKWEHLELKGYSCECVDIKITKTK